MSHQILLWVGFNIFVLILLAVDLGLFHRHLHVIKIKEALGWSVLWILLALLFNAVIYVWQGPVVALSFLTGYLIEKSLDNFFLLYSPSCLSSQSSFLGYYWRAGNARAFYCGGRCPH